MNGGESLVRTALANGVEVCFANPGTSEMDMVAAIDRVPEMRSVLGLFEGVCTGAADGYARMKDKPALTLLHLGPGLSNGLANLHNARRARTPVVNIIGQMASWHVAADAPLTSDIDSLASPVSVWVRETESAASLAADTSDAIAASMSAPRGVATMIVPNDAAWDECAGPAAAAVIPGPPAVEDSAIKAAVNALRDAQPAGLIIGGMALRERGLKAANRIAAATGCKILGEPFPARIDRGAGRGQVERLGYFPESVLKTTGEFKTLILAGAREPMAFFGYKGVPSSLVAETCALKTLARPDDDAVGALEALAEAVGAGTDAGAVNEKGSLEKPASGNLSLVSVGQSIAALLPEGAVIMDEANTSGAQPYYLTLGAAPHASLFLTGGAIGMGLPAATGAAIACPDSQVLALQADGSGMYTMQALWTQAREGLDVTTVIFANGKYAILQVELARAGITERGPDAEALTDLTHPNLDWVKLAGGVGVPGVRVESAEAFTKELEKAFAEPGPHLIEVPI